MCLLLPDNEFDTKEVQAMFEAFPADQVDESISQARNDNLLVDNKSSGRYIRARTLALSKR